MKFTLRGASGAAILAGLAGALPVWAQQAPAAPATGPQQANEQVDQTAAPADEKKGDEERVVVTGSFIAGTPEDAALPVEVYTSEELEKQGAPTALEFVKSLSISGPTSGEAYYFSGAANTGSVRFNLRGLGSGRTLTLLNGRRMSQNTSNIPTAAIARTEVLKDGAAVTYGADAVGGVVNFITRTNFTGMELQSSYKYVDGSDGDYTFSVLGGVGEGETNFLWSAEWEHRSRLSTLKRDFSSQPYALNPAPWSQTTNLISWTPRGTLPASPLVVTNAFASNAALEFGTAQTTNGLSDFTPTSCNAVGGIFVSNTACAYGYANYYNLVEENDIYRLFAQLNTRISDHMDFHAEVSFGEVSSPQVFGSPAQPSVRGPAIATGINNQYYVPSTNPYVGAFVARTGFATNFPTQFAATQGYTSTNAVGWRSMAHGGNPAMGYGNGYGVPSKIDNQVWRIVGELKGDLGGLFKEGLFSEINYNLAGTYNEFISQSDSADVMGFRLQQALNGFGGPACNAPDLDTSRPGTQNAPLAGKNGCLWWNPFASNFAGQPNLNKSNPNYIAGTENPVDLIRWIFDQRLIETVTNNLTVDLVFDGKSGINLPGGEIAWAAGTQWRQTETRETVPSQYYNGTVQCEWPIDLYAQVPRSTSDPNFNGCTPDAPGPFVFFGTNVPARTDQQQMSWFGELQIPVLDNVNLQYAVRREDFSGGLGATIYKVSGKWDVVGPISLRGSYGTNYTAPPAGLVPGRITNGVNSYTKNGGLWLGAQTETRNGIVPETAKVYNLGLLWSSQGFLSDHDFNFSVDYFDVQTHNTIGLLATVNDIAAIVFPGANSPTTLANCSSPFAARVSWNGGACIQGTSNATSFSSIKTEFGNGPGQYIAGYDIAADYRFPLLGGDLDLNLTATRYTVNKLEKKFLDGVQLDTGDNRLGTLNFATIANASSKWRGNMAINYSLGPHNFRLMTNYISGVVDERGCITPAGFQPGTTSFVAGSVTTTNPTGTYTGTPFGSTCYGVNGADWFTFDLHYTFDVTDTLRLSASVVNLADKNPPSAREELGYDPLIGSPLGRTIEVSLKKTF